MAKKFVVLKDNSIRFGNVNFHRDLVEDKNSVKSGGHWEFDKDRKELHLFGRSEDFGKSTIEDILGVINWGRFRFKDSKVLYYDAPYATDLQRAREVADPQEISVFTRKGFKFLKYIIGEDFYQKMIRQAYHGDPDWVYDLIKELDYIDPTSQFYIPDFHDKLLIKGLKTKDFDLDLVDKELDEEVNRKYYPEEEDDDEDFIDPAGGRGLHSHE